MLNDVPSKTYERNGKRPPCITVKNFDQQWSQK